MKTSPLAVMSVLAIALVAGSAFAQQQAGEMTLDAEEASKHFKTRGYSPYADRGFPTRPFWGDTHLHTANSPDAFAFGNRLTPADAYRFARGETVTSSTGQRVQLSRPLDFLVVADHGVAMGAMMELYTGNPDLLKDPQLKRWHLMMTIDNKRLTCRLGCSTTGDHRIFNPNVKLLVSPRTSSFRRISKTPLNG
jgi:hypothetical protein